MVPELPHPTHLEALRRQAGRVLAYAARLRLGRVIVEGESMAPAFQPGDRIVYGPSRALRPGQVIAVHDPRDRSRLLVKRVWSVKRAPGGTTVEVRGDNAAASTDSRQFGPVPLRHVRGRVWYRYAPPDRAGWLPR